MTTLRSSQPDTGAENALLAGWQFGRADAAEWMPWGSDGRARARVVAAADGYHLLEVEAQAGYTGAPHDHAHAEFSYVLSGTVRTNGELLGPGDGCSAAAGSTHASFEAVTDARYLSIFKL